MKASDLRRINRIFEPFGRLPDGRLRIRWFDTFDTALRYFVEKEKTIKTEGGLWVVDTEWEPHFWGERIGKGWVVAIAKPPIPRDQFILRYGTKAPWSGQPDYATGLIENTKRDENDPPTERNTALIKQLIMDQIYRGASIDGGSGKGTEISESLVAQYEKKHEATRKQIEDEIEDGMNAFGNWPGKRGGSVSYGGI